MTSDPTSPARPPEGAHGAAGDRSGGPPAFDGWSEQEFCYLTTTGRRSGRPHRIEIWFVVDDGAVWLLTEPGTAADWVHNLRAQPTVWLEIGGWIGPVTGREVTLSPSHPVRTRVASRYRHADDGLDEWVVTARVVRLEPQQRTA